MQDYEIRRGHQKELDGGKLKQMMQEAFGNVAEEGACLVSRYGALARLTVGWDGKNTLKVGTQMDPKVAPDVAQSTIKKYYEFLERATGFSSKERGKRLQKKAKEGKL
ncbi:MAG: hypothetical protein FJ149_11585 [Euryarchaeota archaeon]|nr:hypothetical protein [Euryarchaeota archaeon]